MGRLSRTCARVGALALAGAAWSHGPLQPARAGRPPASGGGPDFALEVLPILSDRCFPCHGPDAGTREAGLRLDVADAARRSGVLEPLGSEPAELVARILEEDPDWRMPPPPSGLALSEDERDLLRAWVEAGAPFATHWAFVPLPARVAVPDAGEGWALSPLDRFIARAHGREGFAPSPPAAPRRWLRRVTLDLTGLPPTPEELATFLQDDGPASRERVVDDLLSRPAFGERMATPWLDVARYADSWGYQSDRLNTLWPWRDWVVRAFNGNLPFDEFVVWQVAGDLLPEPLVPRRLATAFNRLHRMTNEGGSVEAEWRDASIVDRVETLGSSMLGLTLECARCHDHKFDPIGQDEFYSLHAYFNSIDEWGMYHDSARVPTPSMLLPGPEDTAELERLRARTRAARAEASHRAPDGARLAAAADAALGAAHVRVAIDPDTAVSSEGRTSLGPHASIAGAPSLRPAEGASPAALELDGDTSLGVEGVGRLGPTDAFTLALDLWIPEELDDVVLLHQSAGTDVGYFGFELRLLGGRIHARHVRFWPGNAVALESAAIVPRERWIRVVFAQAGTATAAGASIAVDGEGGLAVVRDRLTKLPGGPTDRLDVGARFRDRGATGARIAQLAVWREDLAATGSAADGALARLADARRAELALSTRLHEVPVMEEAFDAPRPAHVLARGRYDAPRTDANRVARGVPAALTRPGAAPPADRLELARWMVAPDHPLVARVRVNRIWQILFGVGLAATPDDLGLQGARPTHPALLDWLARRFVDSGWDTKALVKEIVLSATYAQDSALRDGDAQRDPENVWLARGPSGRMSAEMLRDAALSAAGLLDTRIGGPPVSPYQPAGLWREANSMSPAYRQSVGADLHRRSLYSVVKRTAPLPNMAAFDAPLRETSCARREATSTPLQALVLLNDVQFVEAARALAARSLEDAAGDVDRALAGAFERLTSRPPEAFELAVLADLFRAERAAFAAAPAESEALLGVGSSPVATEDRARLAAMTATVQAILNLDAFAWKR